MGKVDFCVLKLFLCTGILCDFRRNLEVMVDISILGCRDTFGIIGFELLCASL
jgi:hypothetical protein